MDSKEVDMTEAVKPSIEAQLDELGDSYLDPRVFALLKLGKINREELASYEKVNSFLKSRTF